MSSGGRGPVRVGMRLFKAWAIDLSMFTTHLAAALGKVHPKAGCTEELGTKGGCLGRGT